MVIPGLKLEVGLTRQKVFFSLCSLVKLWQLPNIVLIVRVPSKLIQFLLKMIFLEYLFSPFDKYTVSELRWWLLCRGQTAMKKNQIIEK